MTEQVDFYILGKVNHVAKLRYACRIAQKAYSLGLTVYLHTESSEQSEQLDKLLWTFSQGSFIPHAIANNAAENWQHFPVQLGNTIDDEVLDNGVDGRVGHWLADLLICLTNDIPPAHSKFRRLADLITDTEKEYGRSRFHYYRQQGLKPNTHIIEN